MRNILIPLGFALSLPFAASAQTSPCTVYFDALQAHPVTPPATDGSCRPQLIEALTLDLLAVNAAQPVEGIEAILGTWLGDNIALPFLGIMTPGQEVLEITAADEPGRVLLRQYWYKVTPPPTGPEDSGYPFDAEGHHTNLVAQAELQLSERGLFQTDPFQPIYYPGARLQFRRANDIYIQGVLNRFEGGGQFLRAGEQLVLTSDRLPAPGGAEYPATATYTRVADGAPDTALMLVATFDQSQTRYFDCLTHQISAGEGALFDAIAPADTAALSESLRALSAASAELSRLQRAMRGASDEERATLREQMSAAMGSYRDATQSAVFTSLIAAFEGDTLGCPDPQDL